MASSPGGALLRSSRFFSIPNPLPRASTKLTSSAGFGSESATLPYPTHQAIATPPTSLVSGDWGLKRPLPLRSTAKTTTPLIRVEAVDTIEHVTDYNSAADHVMSLQKWQEMNVALNTPPTAETYSAYSKSRGKTRNVFEEDPKNNSRYASSGGDTFRWDFKGPWLAGQTELEFDNYVEREIRRRRPEFKKLLRQRLAAEISSESRRLRQERGGEAVSTIVSPEDITEPQLLDYTRKLREDKAKLFGMIRDFLDLPPPPQIADSLESILSGDRVRLQGKVPAVRSEDFLPISDSPYARTGPPRTHPSAGLSYLRSNTHITNHPSYGPQYSRPPIESRIIKPMFARGSKTPNLGVGGFVTDVPVGIDGYGTSAQKDVQRGLKYVDPVKKGGVKVHVEPKFASVDSEGRPILEVERSTNIAVEVHEGKVGKIPEELQRPIFW